jgi:hypothetical protein
MMNMDMARAGGEGMVSGDKPEKRKEQEQEATVTGGDNPIFSSEEKKLNIEVPEGWKTQDS